MEYCKNCIIAPYQSFCKCSVNDNICPFVKRCNQRMAWIPLDGMKRCKIAKEEYIMGYKVRFVKNGILYVEIPDKDMVIMIQNPYDHDVDHIDEIICVDHVYYVKGFEPKKEIKKKKTSTSIDKIVD